MWRNSDSSKKNINYEISTRAPDVKDEKLLRQTKGGDEARKREEKGIGYGELEKPEITQEG